MYKANDTIKVGLEGLQRDIKVNYQDTSLERALPWLQEEVDELKAGVAKGDEDNIKEELAQVFIWCISIANILGYSLSEIVQSEVKNHTKKYPKKRAI